MNVQIHDHECRIMLEPFSGLGIDETRSKVRHKSHVAHFTHLQQILGRHEVRKSADLHLDKESQILGRANIEIMDAVYDGLKSTINVMVNMTDGLPWPLNAVPQTFLYILQLLEVRDVMFFCTPWYCNADLGHQSCRSVRRKITSLLFSVQTLWKAVEQVSPETVADNVHLRNHVTEFFECV